MKSTGVLVLSHCGYSFVDQLCQLIDDDGLQRFVLSSKPDVGHEDRETRLTEIADWTHVTNQYELAWSDLEQAIISLKKSGYEISGCICVWEGYRGLMARANKLLGVHDLSEDHVALLADKLAVRQRLNAYGLSRVVAEPLTPDLLQQYQQQEARKFIKPQRGIASFGTFRLTPSITWQKITMLKQEFEDDTVFGGIFRDKNNFIIEDFILGHEFSFEVLALNGEIYTVAVHEKVETSAQAMTTLENACACPPVNIQEGDTLNGIAWLKDVFSALNLDYGCFHVEAKFHEGEWEIIEINPRVGGSLISPSVEHFTGGSSMLQLWLESLLAPPTSIPLQEKLGKLDMAQHGMAPKGRATFFRVYFGHSGTVAAICENPMSPSPEICQIFVKPGTNFLSDSKENFVGQALWVTDIKSFAASYQDILQASKEVLSIQYEPQKIEA